MKWNLSHFLDRVTQFKSSEIYMTGCQTPEIDKTFNQEPPRFSIPEISEVLENHFGLKGHIHPLISERDQNACITTHHGSYVIKIANRAEQQATLEFQNAVLTHLATVAPHLNVPRLQQSREGESIIAHQSRHGIMHWVRLITYLPGKLFSESNPTKTSFQSLGTFMGQLSRALQSFGHPAAHRPNFLWNLDNAEQSYAYLCDITNNENRKCVEAIFERYLTYIKPQLIHLRAAVVHQDANDNNILIDETNKVSGLIDFGDMVFGRQINELAVTLAYALLNVADIKTVSQLIITHYQNEFPLTHEELEVLWDLVAIRLAMSVCISSHQIKKFPDNKYLLISQQSAFELLYCLAKIKPIHHENSDLALLTKRTKLLGPSFSMSYQKKLHIVRGKGTYLYDNQGKAYLDCVNNIAHVGHCHPKVVNALSQQAAILNTNTRYLHETILTYAERILATLPKPLEVIYFVCSGSEANELALRLSRAMTGRKNIAVLDWAYHGNTTSLIDISPYKFKRQGGFEKPNHVFIATLPDPYRGAYKDYTETSGKSYSQSIANCIEDMIQETGAGPAALLAESISGCGGQIVFPDGYLKHAFELIRHAGGVCILDEVQVGFGRVGNAMWAFEGQQVVPDILTLGKPMGNGHPIAAVVTTREIADKFNNGMEYFNSFGGNPVSCAVGMAVMDVIEEEGLSERALETGNYLLKRFNDMKTRHELIGDVRGKGLFLGIELVRNRENLEPADTEANTIINRLRERGILVSTDGPYENVLKIKPPLVFGCKEADMLCEELEKVL